VEKVCDRVIIIDRGKLRYDDRLSAIQSKAPIYVVEVRGPGQEAFDLIKGLPGITEIKPMTTDEGFTTFEIRTAHGEDPRERVAKKMTEKGYGVRRLEIRREKLEDTYMRVVFQRG